MSKTPALTPTSAEEGTSEAGAVVGTAVGEQEAFGQEGDKREVEGKRRDK